MLPQQTTYFLYSDKKWRPLNEPINFRDFQILFCWEKNTENGNAYELSIVRRQSQETPTLHVTLAQANEVFLAMKGELQPLIKLMNTYGGPGKTIATLIDWELVRHNPLPAPKEPFSFADEDEQEHTGIDVLQASSSGFFSFNWFSKAPKKPKEPDELEEKNDFQRKNQ